MLRRHAVCFAAVLCLATAAQAAPPTAEALLTEFGLSADDIAAVKGGKLWTLSPTSANSRDLAAGLAFFVKATPAQLVKEFSAGVLLQVDPNTLASGALTGEGSLDAFAKLSLKPETVKKFQQAAAGDALNLSAEEIAALKALGGDKAAPADVEAKVKALLLARYQAYRAKGLGGIAVYDRGSDKRSAADELRSFVKASKTLQKYAPTAFAALDSYPGGKPADAEERFKWVYFLANKSPTLALVHGMAVKEGDATVVMQRQYYVSEGFNCEEAVATLFPVAEGTVITYANHTSTDQVEGFGGGMKKSIGTKMMSGQLQSLFEKLQKKAR
jgi:hypothetical protein